MTTISDGLAGDGSRGSSGEGRVLQYRAASGGAAYDEAFDRALERVLDTERRLRRRRRRAAEVADRVRGRNGDQGRLLLHNLSANGGWWAAGMLADEAEACAAGDPRRACELSRLALDLLAAGEDEEMEPELRPLVEDAAARAWRVLGDALRRRSEVEAAGRALAEAGRHRRRGTGEPLEQALLLEARGRLLACRGARRAETALAAAAGLFRRLGEGELEARARLALGLWLASRQDELSQGRAAEELRAALPRVGEGVDAGLVCRGRRALTALTGAPAPGVLPVRRPAAGPPCRMPG